RSAPAPEEQGSSAIAGSNRRLQQTQAQVDEVVRVNVGKVLERDQKLSDLEDRAGDLQAGASQFETDGVSFTLHTTIYPLIACFLGVSGVLTIYAALLYRVPLKFVHFR
uniref:V-SNARE coiled-coil homology domain-containing protein n=1 Tax=Denticeps clupeoides TaxID=299321 RepID=A0A8C4AEG9_9TELE